MEDIKKRKREIEQKLAELKGKQAAHFQKKKADRDADALSAIRDQMNELKAEVRKLYRPEREETAQEEVE